MTPIWVSAFLDLAPGDEVSAPFWSAVTGHDDAAVRERSAEFPPLRPPSGDPYLYAQRLGSGEGRVHVDLYVDDLDAAQADASALGARVVARHDHVLLTSPAGLPFCLVPDRRVPDPTARRVARRPVAGRPGVRRRPAVGLRRRARLLGTPHGLVAHAHGLLGVRAARRRPDAAAHAAPAPGRRGAARASTSTSPPTTAPRRPSGTSPSAPRSRTRATVASPSSSIRPGGATASPTGRRATDERGRAGRRRDGRECDGDGFLFGMAEAGFDTRPR